MSDPNFEIDTQALFALIDLSFDTNTRNVTLDLRKEYDNRSSVFFEELSKISAKMAATVSACISKPYRQRLGLYYSPAGLELFIRMTIDFKIKQVLDEGSR